MMHDTWTDRLSEYVDGELGAAARSALEAHLDSCDACRETVVMLRGVQLRARRLADRAPARDLWPAIAAMIGPESPVLEQQPVQAPPRRRRYIISLPQLAAAGVALAVLSGGTVWLLGKGGPVPVEAPAVAGTPAPGRPAPGAANASVRAEQTYDAAVADLQAVLDAGRTRLDPHTVAVLERNLAVIDSAVSEAQRALAADPADTYLNSYLARTMRRKVELLRQAATLVSARS